MSILFGRDLLTWSDIPILQFKSKLTSDYHGTHNALQDPHIYYILPFLLPDNLQFTLSFLHDYTV